LLLLRQTVVNLAFQMPHVPLFFVAHISRFDSHYRRAADRLHFIVDGLLIEARSICGLASKRTINRFV
jgi:hypothetical protein